MDNFDTLRQEVVSGQGQGQGLAKAALCVEYQGIEEYDPAR